MKYNILEARIEFKDGEIERITLLVDMSIKPGRSWDIRAIFANKRMGPGYYSIQPGDRLDTALLQKVAGYGMETIDRGEIFKDWKKYYK